MALLKTIAEVKKYVRVNFNNANASLPNMEKAARKFIVPVIGQGLYNKLQTVYDTPPPVADAYTKLLSMVQAALAPLAYWMELPLINAEITDAGLRKPGTADMAPVFKHDFYQVLTNLSDSGMDEIEALLAFLEANSAQYNEWTTSPAYESYKKFFIKTGTEFNAIYTLYHPRRCWLDMSSIIQMVEEMYIEKTIGSTFAAELRNATNPTVEQAKATKLVKSTIAYLTIMHAVSQRPARLTSAGFTIQMSDPDTAAPSRQAAADPVLARLQQEVEHVGQSYLVDLIAYLNTTASGTVFPTYFNSALYKAPATGEDCSINSQLKSSFSFI